ncbi:BamA/TamA family outer membrane protein [Arthrospiribacter ruber]|uniref:Bacterial surface antigen (D15) domain-containing protein n=1 Tax=Arthrospiribacter ruber TaxID=2487934 RepID=A0A951IUW0_9BACT|nr:BamA/TamA family outer membrane protein [Arthrospiribacter ruber]MBW3466792.1 hypothetical protein [Arthrospiribacter ruber]
MRNSNVKKFYSVFTLILIFSGSSFAQNEPLDKPGKEEKQTTIAVLPLIYYTPETSWAFGAGAVANFRLGAEEETFESQVALGGAYTLFNQFLSYTSWRIFTEQNKHLFAGELGWYDYVFFFYGIGPGVSESDREVFNSRLPRLRFDYLRLIKGDFYVGVRYWYDNFQIQEVEEGGLLDGNNIPGSMGGRIGGIGPMLYYDSRDSQLYPTSGMFAESSLQIFRPWAGSDYSYMRWIGDFRQVLPIKENSVFVYQAYAELLSGEVPFFGMPLLGGNRLMRGLFEGKFRDRNMALVQGEYRWKFKPRWGLVGFSGLGNIFSPSNPFDIGNTKLTYGTGLRYQLSKKEKLNLRFDVAHSPGEGLLFYLTFGEGF